MLDYVVELYGYRGGIFFNVEIDNNIAMHIYRNLFND